MDSIMMKIDDLLEMHSSLNFPVSDLGIARDWAKSFSTSWWEGSGGEKLKGAVNDWSFQMQGIMDEFEKLYKRINYEVEEWTTADLKFDYEGAEIDTIKELKQLWWDVLSGDLQPGDLMMTIDLKEVFDSNLPWDWRYPPEKTSIWVQVGNEWVRYDFTGSDWDLDLILNAETRTAFIDWSWNAGSANFLWSYGNGFVQGGSHSFFNLDASAGFSQGVFSAGGGAWFFSVEEFIGRNISEYDYQGYHHGISLFGFDISTSYKEKGIDVKPNTLSGGKKGIIDFEFGLDQGKPRDPKPPERVP